MSLLPPCVQQAVSEAATPSKTVADWEIDTVTLVSSGAVAATAAGMLSALSGIGGPPLILMYELLAVPKVLFLSPFFFPCLNKALYWSEISWHVHQSACVSANVLCSCAMLSIVF